MRRGYRLHSRQHAEVMQSSMMVILSLLSDCGAEIPGSAEYCAVCRICANRGVIAKPDDDEPTLRGGVTTSRLASRRDGVCVVPCCVGCQGSRSGSVFAWWGEGFLSLESLPISTWQSRWRHTACTVLPVSVSRLVSCVVFSGVGGHLSPIFDAVLPARFWREPLFPSFWKDLDRPEREFMVIHDTDAEKPIIIGVSCRSRLSFSWSQRRHMKATSQSVHRPPTHTASTDAHSVSAHNTAQSDHFSSREKGGGQV